MRSTAEPAWKLNRQIRLSLVAIIVVLSVVVGIPALAAADGSINSWFSDDADGWRISGDATSPEYVETGGNPGGHICADDNVAGNAWYFAAPDKFRGDRSGAYGGELQFDLKQSSTSSQFSNHDVILRNGSATLVYDFGNASDHPRTNWTHYSVPLDASADGWTWESGKAVSAAAFETVLGNLTQLRIRGEYKSGSDRGCLDNVQLPSDTSGDSSSEDDDPSRVSIDSPVENDEVIVENANNQTIAGSTNLADGTRLNMTVATEPGSDTVIFRSIEVVVNDGTFGGDFDFRGKPVGTQFTVSVREDGTKRASRDGSIIERPASVQIAGQEATSQNPIVVVASADLPAGGFIVIHNKQSLQAGNRVESVLGNSTYLDSGQYANIPVPLDEPLSNESIDVVAMPHRDDNNNTSYDFVSSDGQLDEPYVLNGSAVTDSASIAVTSSPTPTATRTPVPSPSPTPTETPTPTNETDTPDTTADETETTGSDGPGFGLVAGLLTLLLGTGALLARR